jgi:hypothetical protein
LVKDASFNQTLGSGDNPIPNSVFTNEKIWVVVNDLLSPLYSIFDVIIDSSLKQTKQNQFL